MFRLLSIITLLASIGSYAKNIQMQGSINIKASLDKVYKFASDSMNDKYWRTEVNKITSNGIFGLGTRYIEDAKLGIHSNYITKTEVIDFVSNQFAIYETIPENKFYLRSSRFFEKVSTNETKFTYVVNVEENMIKDIWGFKIPTSIATYGYRMFMKSYLRKLKNLLED
jgi:hypothetical protein